MVLRDTSFFFNHGFCQSSNASFSKSHANNKSMKLINIKLIKKCNKKGDRIPLEIDPLPLLSSLRQRFNLYLILTVRINY